MLPQIGTLDLAQIIGAAARAARPSKRAAPGKGNVRLGSDSGIRKLQRAMRRGTMPMERIGVIVRALESADFRRRKYRHSTRTV